jgi:pectin methylesterase-like acyl-CoA thioesterase
MSKLSRNLRKKLSAGLAAIMAVSLAIPAGVSFSSQTVKAEGLTSETKDGDAFYDFRDGSVVPTDTDGKSDITYGNLTIKVGTKNAFNYHGSSHGTLFKDGNSFEIKVNGSTKITLGGCQYSQSGSITASSADGSYTETKEAKTKDCYHNASNYTNEDDYSVSFNYTGETATTITVSFTGQTYVPCLSVKSLKKFYDFRDGSIVPTDTDGKKDISYGGLTIKVGTKNAFKYNDAAHGVRFNDGNALEIAVSGPTKITLGGCQYSATGTITATSADGSYSETKDAKTKDCYHNASKYTNEDDYSISFSYNGDAATIITLAFSNQTYVPCLAVTAITEDIADNNGAVKDSVAVYNFSDGSVLPTTIDSVNPLNGSITSKDNMLTVTGAGDLYVHDAQHGLALYGGNTFEIKVAGDATVTFNMCQYGGDSTAKIVASSKKGKFTSPKEQLLMDGKADGLSSMSFRYEGVATTLTFTVVAEKEMYLHGINVSNDPEKTETPALVGNGKADVWDFGAAQLDSTKYNNMLTADIINSWYSSDVTPGSSGVTLGSFATDEFFFNPAGKTNNRIRTSNTAITRYDAGKTAKIDNTEFTGYLYSNNTTPTVVVGIKLYKNDILTLYTGSNGGASTIVCESPSGQIQSGESNVDGTKLQFAASEYGVYKIYSTNEKLVVYRAIREHTQPITVNGTLDTTNAAGLDSKDYSIVFTNNLTGEKTVVIPTAGNYSTYLNEMYDYSVSLENANGYVISSANKFSPAKGTGDQKFDITVKAVDLAVVTGKIKGLTENELANLKLSFSNKNYVYVPEFTVSGDNIVIKVEKGVTYNIIAEGINDYYLSDIKTLTASQDITQDITFAAKPTYKVSLSFDGLPSDAAPNVVFSNINEEGYVYTFKDLSNIKLRDGQYSVTVNNIGNVAYQQKLTSDLKVNGADVSKTVNFKQVSSWDFSSFNGNPGIETIGENNYYSGLALSGTVLENKIYLLEGADGEIKIPVKKNQIVTLSYCYCASFSINDGDVIASKSGSTDKIESTQYVATEDGTVTVKGASSTVDGASVTQTYFTSITVTDIVEYRAQLFVGNDKEFKTINAALDNVRAMNRTKDERVEIVIDPGNYEEMLVIDMPAVSLVNAAGSDSSLEITNKGVDIGENVVRVTSYYGHGYNYYSMNSGCKYDEELLAVNKENGSYTKKNPGSGTTDGSYWNSTVVVKGSDFKADGIVFENSFNQYISEKEANDIVVAWDTGSKGIRPTTAGDTSVQNRSFVERAAAMVVLGNNATFTGCKFIGRQDTLYGQTNINVMFNQCDVLGTIDYIFGGMTAIFYKCNLIFNTSDVSSDIGYITAAQQAGGRGYIMYECNVTSTTPGVDTASEYRSKPGYFGRPWAANTSEVVFYNTTVETSNYPGYEGKSLINPEGWNNSLGGESTKMYEYGTVELSGENNLASRVSWAATLTSPAIDNGTTPITLSTFINSKADYTNVINAIKKASFLNAADYKDFSEVEKAVNAVTNNLAIDDQNSVEAMADAILTAINGLEKVSITPENPGNNGSDTPDSNNSGSNGTADNASDIATGDTSPIAMLILMILASLAGLVGILTKKYFKRV